MADQDLITYARDAASRGDDLFALLATDATASESDIRRAFRRKALTAHPDKAGDAFDPALYERIERARDVLLDSEAREAYDNGMRAVLQKKMQLDQMSQKRRQMVEELERREAEAKRAKTDGAGPRFQHDAERAAMAARGRAKMEEMRRMREQAEVRERLAREKEEAAGAATATATKPPVAATGKPDMAGTRADNQPTPPPPVDADADAGYDERIAELEKRLKEKQQRKAEKEQRKAEKKGKKAGTPVPGSPGRDASNHPPSPPAAESQADEDKVSKPAEAASQSDTGNAPKPGGFASTMARLRAAQAKKDEEKRRKAEEAARAEGVSAS